MKENDDRSDGDIHTSCVNRSGGITSGGSTACSVATRFESVADTNCGSPEHHELSGCK